MQLFRKLLWLLALSISLNAFALAQDAPTAPQEAPEAEHHVTKAEAKELFRSIDDILQFASEHTGLPIRHSVKKKLATRGKLPNMLTRA